jgi:hypothetical protein
MQDSIVRGSAISDDSIRRALDYMPQTDPRGSSHFAPRTARDLNKKVIRALVQVGAQPGVYDPAR